MSALRDILTEDSVLRQQWLSVEMAADLVVAFEERFGEAALELACHASVPLVVDAGMLQLIRQNFLSQAALSWVAEADLLLSPLCRPIGGECYQFEPRVRECLLVELEDRFGSARQGWIAEWLLAFGDSPVSQAYPPEVKHTHRWIGLAYTHPEELLEEMSATVQMTHSPSASSWAIAGQIQVATTVEMVKDVLEQRIGAQADQLQDLSQQAKLLSYYWYGDRETLQRQAKEEAWLENETQAGVPSSLSIVIDWIAGQPSQGKEEKPPPKSKEASPRLTSPYQLPPKPEDELVSGDEGSFEPVEWLKPLVEEWVARIQKETPTFVVLTGTAGSNRTKVVRAIAEALAPHYPDGLVYVDGRKRPETSDETAYLVTAVLNALAPQESFVSQRRDHLLGAYQEAFHKRSVCVVVDYVEAVKAGLTGEPNGPSKVSIQSKSSKTNAGLHSDMEPPPGNVLLAVGARVPGDVSTALVLDLDAEQETFLKKSDEAPTQKGGIVLVQSERIGRGYKDQEAVRQIVQQLRSLGGHQDVEVWNTSRVYHEPDGNRQFAEALEAAQAVVLLVTPHLLKQREGNFIHLMYESAQRLAGQGPGRFFPVLLEPCDASDLTWIRGMSFHRWPRNGQALSTMDESRQMMEWQLIMGEIRRTVQEPRKSQESSEREVDHEASTTTGSYDIAVTYAWPDSDRVAPIVKGLRDEGWTVWWDRDLQEGNEWDTRIKEIFQASSVHLVMVSKQWEHSDHARKETERGLKTGRVVPILLDRMAIPDMLQDLKRFDLRGWNGEPHEDKWHRLVDHLRAILDTLRTRPGITQSDGMVLIPKGPFLYGNDKEEISIDHDYYMDIHPVTNADYQKFIEAEGYDSQTYWSQEAWQWRTAESITKPTYWDNEKFNGPDQPVVGVSYHEAEAYAKWAGKRLPTQQEWEKAARGTDGREYPWGNVFDADRCANSVGKEGRDRTAPIESYPDGQSPFGCQDMAGNVWEWCASWNDDEQQYRVLRGGSWYVNSPEDFRCADWSDSNPKVRGSLLGFRCVQDAP